jgi:hypothetical protein
LIITRRQSRHKFNSARRKIRKIDAIGVLVAELGGIVNKENREAPFYGWGEENFPDRTGKSIKQFIVLARASFYLLPHGKVA